MAALSIVKDNLEIIFNAVVGIPNDANALMHFAIRRGNIARFKKALARGANHEARDEIGRTPLESAVQYKCPEMVKELLARKADHKGGRFTDCGSFSGAYLTVPIVDAAMAGSMEMVKLLAEAGANINTRGHEGWTALHVATVHANREMTDYLLAQGADPNIPDRRGNIPLYYAFQGRGDRSVALALIETEAYLPDAGAAALRDRAKECGWQDIAAAIEARDAAGIQQELEVKRDIPVRKPFVFKH